MRKIYIYALVIFVAIVAVLLMKREAVAPVDEALPLSDTASTESSATSTIINDTEVKVAPALPQTLGDLAFVLPESKPSNTAPAPGKDFIKDRMFGNYKAETSSFYIPVNNSASWSTFGYNATVFVSKTDEICHINELQTDKYTNPSKITLKIYDGSFLENDYQYAMQTYQVTTNGACYNVGIFEEFKLLDKMNLSEADKKPVQAKRDSESARVRGLLKKLVDSVRLK